MLVEGRSPPEQQTATPATTVLSTQNNPPGPFGRHAHRSWLGRAGIHDLNIQITATQNTNIPKASRRMTLCCFHCMTGRIRGRCISGGMTASKLCCGTVIACRGAELHLLRTYVARLWDYC